VSPGFIDAGEIRQVGIGAGPVVTAHPSAMFPENPPCAGNVSTSLACPPRRIVRLVAAGLTEKSGSRLKPAVTFLLEFSVTLQPFESLPVHAPLQPTKVEFPPGLAASV